MSGTTISGAAYVSGVTLSNAASYNPVTITAAARIGNAGGAGVLGTGTTDWTITNAGTVRSTGTTIGADGIALMAGGTITNQAAGLISGGDSGVSLTDAGAVVNSGAITGAAGNGVALAAGGAVTNNASGVISGYLSGVSLGAAGTVINRGSIGAGHSSSTSNAGVLLNGGGGVSNEAGGTISSYSIGVFAPGGGTIDNAGVISSTRLGVALDAVASLDNEVGGTIYGANYGVVVYAGTRSVAVTNSGSIVAGEIGVAQVSPGSVSNAVAGVISANIGVYLGAGGTVTNAGSISAQVGTGSVGIYFRGGGYATNALTGTIASTSFGVYARYVAATAVNQGQISSTGIGGGAGVQLKAGGTIVNGVSGTITAKFIGAQIGGFTRNNPTSGYTYTYAPGGTIINNGLIFASDGTNGAAAWIKGAGVLLNSATGTISGGPFGVVTYDPVTITNAGLIIGTEFAVFAANAGVVDRVIVAPSARFTGLVAGSKVTTASAAAGILELQAGGAGTITGFGSKYIGFAEVILDAGAAWSLGGTVAASQTLIFAGANATLTLANPGSVAGTLSGFAASDTIALAGITDVTSATLGADNLLTVTQSAGPNLALQLDPAQNFSGNNFAFTAVGSETDITVPCFAAGTRIRTRRGEIAVERLELGDMVVNPWGEMLPVVWLGHRRVDCRRHPRPADVHPVRVRAHAFAPGQPARDLWLSPDHSVFIDGDLIPVRHLVNGISIAQIAVPSIEYWHVELPRHDVLLAEGMPSESYLDTNNRDAFAGGSATQLRPDFVGAALEIWNTHACGRLVLAGAALAAARRQVLDRLPADAFDPDPDLHVLADGARIEATRRGQQHRFAIPVGCRTIRLASRTAIPAQVLADSDDARRLGAAVCAISLDGRALALDDIRLAAGWWPGEAGLRWTDGAAALPACRHAAVTLAPLLRYPAESVAGDGGARRVVSASL